MVRIPYTYPDDEKKYDTRLRHSFPIPTKSLKLVSGTDRVQGNQAGISTQLVPFFFIILPLSLWLKHIYSKPHFDLDRLKQLFNCHD